MHSYFGETLSFFLFRLNDPSRDRVTKQLRLALDAAQIRFACEYTVFGYWDGLVRAWTTEPARTRLLRLVRQSEFGVESTLHFQALHVHHLWSDATSDASADLLADADALAGVVLSHERTVRRVVEAETASDADISSLVDAGLLIERTPLEAAEVKFYIALSRIGADVPGRGDDGEDLLRTVESARLGPRMSIYRGQGFTDALLRCVAPSYKSVLGLTSQLDRVIRDSRAGLRPMTFLVADSEPRESDNINAIGALSATDDAIAGHLGLDGDGRRRLQSLSREQREVLHGFAQRVEVRAQGHQRLRARLLDLLRACVLSDEDGVSAATAFMLEFEYLLGQYLIRAWAEVRGGAWMQELATELANVSGKTLAEAIRTPADWGLGTELQLAVATAQLDDTIRSRYAMQLGEGWEQDLRRMLDARNYVAHAKFRHLDSLDNFDQREPGTGPNGKTWGTIIGDLIDVAGLYQALSLTRNDTEHDGGG